MRYGLDQCHIGLEHIFQDVLGVPGRRHPENFQLCLLRFYLPTQALEHFDGVLDRVAVGELVRLTENVSILVQQDSFGRSRAAVNPDETANRGSALKNCGSEFLAAVRFFEAVEFCGTLNQSLPAGFRFLLLPAVFDVTEQAVMASIAADAVVLAAAELDCPHGGEILCIVRDFDQIFGFGAIWDCDLTLLPHARDVCLPGLAHTAYEAIWTSEQQHMRPQSMSAGKNAQVLQNDGFKKGSHQLVRRSSHFLQTIDVGFREHAAFACNLVQLDSVIALIAQFEGRNFQLGIDLVDDGARAAGALVIHRGNLLLAPSLLVIFEDNDLGILATELNNGIHLRVQFFHRQGDGCYLLNKFRADLVRNRAAIRAGHKHARVMAVDVRFRFHPLQEFQGLLRLLGFMPLIVLPEHLVGRRLDHDGLDRGRTHVKSYQELGTVIAGLRCRFRLRDGRMLAFKGSNLN